MTKPTPYIEEMHIPGPEPKAGIDAAKIVELKRIAEAATPGPWSVHEHDVWCDKNDEPNAPLFRPATEYRRWGRDIRPDQHGRNAAHIVAFDPPTVLALLDALDEARELAYTRDIFDPSKLSDVSWKMIAESHEKTVTEQAGILSTALAERDEARREAGNERTRRSEMQSNRDEWQEAAEQAEAERDEARREAEKQTERADKFMWQVRDTCTRAEQAEAENKKLRAALEIACRRGCDHCADDIRKAREVDNAHRA